LEVDGVKCIHCGKKFDGRKRKWWCEDCEALNKVGYKLRVVALLETETSALYLDETVRRFSDTRWLGLCERWGDYLGDIDEVAVCYEEVKDD